MTNKKYILGGGISALIYKYYHPEFQIISPDIGGKLNNDSIMNIIYLHATKEVEDFLKELDFNIDKKTHLIKYVKNDICIDEITVSDKIQMIKKKLDDENFIAQDMRLSTNDYFISVYEINLKELIEKLSKNIEIINDKVIRITDKEIITENTRFDYDEIISTIPANIFWKIYYKPTDLEFKSKDITFVLSDCQPEILSKINYKLCYFLDNKYKYTRVSKREGKYLYEFTGSFNKLEIEKYLPDKSKILDLFIEKNAILYSNEKNIPPRNINFLGRFATHKHQNKINHSVEFSQWNYDFRNIWNRQEDFFNKVYTTKTFKDLNLKNIGDKEKITQSILLHMQSEMMEILEEINYKTHKPIKYVNVDNIKLEIIDTFKYLLTLCLIWNISTKEFCELFNKKSDIVEQRFEKTQKEMEDKK